MTLIHLIGLLIIVGVILSLVPMDAVIRRWILIILAVIVLFVLLSAVGLWPF